MLDRAEAIIARYLTGVVIELPAPEDLKQVTLELAGSLWLTKGTPARLGPLASTERAGILTPAG